MKTVMPKINPSDIEDLTYYEREILDIILKADYSIRVTRPPIKDSLTGEAAYVWRMICFYVSPKSLHHHFPAGADFYLKERNFEKRRELTKKLDKFVDKIIVTVPKDQHHGLNRWANILGY